MTPGTFPAGNFGQTSIEQWNAKQIDAFARTLAFVSQHSDIFSKFLASAGPEATIHVPFSGGFDEAPAVHRFLSPQLPASWRSVTLEATDVHLPQNMGYTSINDPKFRFSHRYLDLSKEKMPKCHLALGLHPQVVGFENDGWDRIIHEVVTGAEATLFTTWMKVECDKLVQMCRQLGCEVQSWQNPHALPEQGEDNLSKRFHYIVIAKRPGHGPQTQGSAATPATMVGSKIISNPMTVGSGSTPVSRLPTESLQTAPTNASFVTQAPHTSVYLGTRGSGSYGTPLNQPIGFASPYQQPSFGNPSYSATAFNGHPTSMAGYSTTTSARPVSYNQVPRFVSGSSGYYSEYSSRPLTRF
uniref:Uncharacterized protein n=1 Tax=Eutreptiella gymnastica TaxID=73025 RepID=A0A7S4L9Z9_9EUGL